MLTRSTVLTALLAGCSVVSYAQVTNVTEVITDFNGFWQSSAAAPNAVRPDNSHNLLLFTVDGKRYSTGVNDAALTARGVTFTPGDYRALPVSSIPGTLVSETKVGLGQLYDKIDNGPSNPAPTRDLPSYLRDGVRGLNIGTGIANLPKGTLSFDVESLTSASINDGVPDVMVTQIADPSGSQDDYQFTDENNIVVGNKVTVVFGNIQSVGTWTADFYEATQNPLTLVASFTKTDRPMRLWVADLTTFGITAANASRVRKFQVLLSGSSDIAFVAYNNKAAVVANAVPLPVQLSSFEGRVQGRQAQLSWQTSQELNASHFEVEASTDGQHFSQVGRVSAAGTTQVQQRYSFRHAPALPYYRLRQVDEDGTSHYTSVVALSAVGVAPVALQATPTPFGRTLTLRLTSPGRPVQQASVALLAADGRAVYQRDVTDQFRTGQLELQDLPDLQPGIYLVRLVADGQHSLVRVVKE